MKHSIVFILFVLSLVCVLSTGNAQNPFTAPPEARPEPAGPSISQDFFVRIIQWQHQLRQKMAGLVRETRTTGSPGPLLLLLGAALVYGMVHSAGPGHGKVLALSYILTQRPRPSQAVLFGSLIALFHGASGILLIVIIRIVLRKNMTGPMDSVSRVTQLASFGLITCLGLAILVHGIYQWRRKANSTRDRAPDQKRFAHPVLTSLAVGAVPCPGVVMVMLFALSMDLMGLGIILGLTISVGMALTVTGVVLAGLSGKAASLSMVSGRQGVATKLERGIELCAALAVTGLGAVFFYANL